MPLAQGPDANKPRGLILLGLTVLTKERNALSLRWIPALLLCMLVGCTTTRMPYTAMDAERAEIPGYSHVRFIFDDLQPPELARFRPSARNTPIRYLTISGGGAGGAFSVGVLNAWTETGRRPMFDIVSGVSTGALIAPFAFLGPDYDDELRQLYTSGIANQLVEQRFILSGLFGESLLKQDPLRRLVERYVTGELLQAVAAEYRKGRNLFVSTTNLDSQRTVVWDLGAIAASGQPDALTLFRSILIASASIPGVYPAVGIATTINGKPVTELHSDGGPSAQILSLPDVIMTRMGTLFPAMAGKVEIYVLVNNTLGPEFQLTKSATFPVAMRAYATLVKSQAKSSIMALYQFSRRFGFQMKVAAINVSVPYSYSKPFSTQYMRAVYRNGYDRMKCQKLWSSTPEFDVVRNEAFSLGACASQ